MSPKLTVCTGSSTGKSLYLEEGDRVVLGRSPRADLPIDGESISRRHCIIEYRSGRLAITDLGSTNGTFINRQPVQQARLHDGDLLHLGNCLLTIDFLDPVRVTPRSARANSADETSTLDVDPEDGLSISAAEAAQKATMAPSTRALQNLRSLYQVARVVSSEDRPEALSRHLTEKVLDAVPADRVAVIFPDNTNNAFASRGESAPLQFDGEFSVSRRVVSEVMGKGRAVLSHDALLDDRYRASQSVLTQSIRSVMCVPLTGKTGALGVFYADSLTQPRIFTREDLELLSAIGQQAGLAIERARLVKGLENLFIGTIRTLAATVEAKDPYTHGHSQRVTSYALTLADMVGIDPEKQDILEVAGLLHDVGKIGVPEHILHKPGPLEPHEFATVRHHPRDGASIILNIPHAQIIEVARAVRAHHERWDGSGYPDGLKATEAPFIARILTVADAYDAMTSDRPYRKGFSPIEAIRRLKKGTGTQFEPDLVDAFVQAYRDGLLEPELETSKFSLPTSNGLNYAAAPPASPFDFDEEENTQIICRQRIHMV